MSADGTFDHPSDDRPWWHEQVACLGKSWLMFPNDPSAGGAWDAAYVLCAQCEFSDECREEGDALEVHLDRYVVQGMRAGETPTQRRKRRGW